MTFLSGAEIEMAGVDNILELNSKLNNVSTIFDITYNTSYVLKMLLLISSLFSLIIGTIVGLSATKIKRLFAYSTVSHIGFILLALAINSEQSVDAFLFYILQYSITNLNIFLILLALGFLINNNGIKTYNKGLVISLFDFDIRYISDIKGQFLSNPLLSFSLAISLFSFAGLPPLLGFFSKQFVLYSAIQNGYYFISVIAILVSVISASYYLRIILLLFTEKDTNVNNSNNSSIEQPNLINKKNMLFPSAEFKVLTNVHSFLISTITLLILFFILKPSILLNSTQLLALSLFNS
jgi:NADH-ubiquinone oxidoreductase chain 2